MKKEPRLGLQSGLFFVCRANFIKRRIASVEILSVEIILRDAQSIAEALVVNDLAGAEEFDRVADVGIVRKAQDVVVGSASLLLCYYHVFATKLSLAKVRKILIFQGLSALLALPIFQKFQ